MSRGGQISPPAAAGRSPRVALSRTVPLALLATIAVFSLYLRWQGLEYAEFNYDQAWSLNRAYEFFHHGNFPFFGEISSQGVPHGPVEIFLLTIPLLVSTDPIVATAFVGLLQALAVVGTYFVGRRAFGTSFVGLAAAGLYAVNPWALTFARKLWPPSVMPLTSLMLLAALYLAAAGKRYALTAAFGLASVLAMSHPSGFVFLPVVGVWTLIFWRKFTWRPVVAGLVAAIVVASPYLIYDAQQRFTFVRGYLRVPGNVAATVDLTSVEMIVSLTSEGGLRGVLEPSFGAEYVRPLFPAVDPLATALLALGTAYCVWRVVDAARTRGRTVVRWEPYLLLLVWLGIPVVLTLRHSMPLNHAYFVALWPAQFLLIALSLVALTRCLVAFARSSRAEIVSMVAAGAVVVALSVSQVAFFVAREVSARSLPPVTDWGMPLAYSKEAVSEARRLRQQLGDPTLMAFVSHNQWVGLNYLSQPDLKLEKVEPPQYLVLPNDLSRGVVAMIGANDAASSALDFAALSDASPVIAAAHNFGFVDLPESTVYGPRGHEYVRFLYLSAEAAKRIPGALTVPTSTLTLGNGLSLAGVRYSESISPSGEVGVTAVWKMPSEPSRYPWTDYVLFGHIVDRTGKEVAWADWPVFQYRSLWRAGDYLVSDYRLQVPGDRPGQLLWLDLGAYDRVTREQVAWVDGNGARTGSAYKFGPMKWTGDRTYPEPSVKMNAAFGASIILEGYDVSRATGDPAGAVDVRLRWRAVGRPTADYVVSVQLLDEEGNLLAQHDAPPGGGDLPATYWEAGEVVEDLHRLPVNRAPGGAAPRFAVVVYDPQTQARLAVNGTDYLELATGP